MAMGPNKESPKTNKTQWKRINEDQEKQWCLLGWSSFWPQQKPGDALTQIFPIVAFHYCKVKKAELKTSQDEKNS